MITPANKALHSAIWENTGKVTKAFNDGIGRLGSTYPDSEGVELCFYDEHNLFICERFAYWGQLEELLNTH